MTTEQQELLFAGNFLIERGYCYPEDFNGDTAIDQAAKYITKFIEDTRTKTRGSASNL